MQDLDILMQSSCTEFRSVFNDAAHRGERGIGLGMDRSDSAGVNVFILHTLVAITKGLKE